MMRWLGFLLKLPFLLVWFALYAVYFLLWHLLRLIGHNFTLGAGLLAIVAVGLQPNGMHGDEMLAFAAGWGIFNRVCNILARTLPRPGARPKLGMPAAPKRTTLARPSPVQIAVARRPASASPSEAVMRSRLDPALQAIMHS